MQVIDEKFQAKFYGTDFNGILNTASPIETGYQEHNKKGV